MTGPHARWKWASLLAGALALWLSYAPDAAPYITNDGYQYLDAASNLASGPCLCTRVALFDEQVAFGRFPIPFTHFAPGYPLLIAALSRTGIAAETAGYLISALAFLAALWLILDIALVLGARAWVAAAFGLIWITHADALLYASTVGTESLFTALLLALAALIVRDAGSDSGNPFRLVGIGVVAGLSYWVRYPGLFLAAGAGVYLIFRAWRVPRARRGALGGLAAAAALVGLVQIRNARYTGSWRGGFKSGGGHGPGTLVVETVKAFFHLVTGNRVPAHFDIRFAILSFAVALVLFLGIRTWFAPSPFPRDEDSRIDIRFEPMGWALFIGFAYVGGVALAALTTIADDLPRYYFPVYPLFLACAAVVCSTLARGVKSLAVILLVLSIVAVESRSLLVRPWQPDWILTRMMLAEEVEPGATLVQWLQGHTGAEGTIVAVEGQAAHYILQRPVVAVLPAEFSGNARDEQGFRSLMRQFGSRYLLLFPNAPPERIPDQNSYGFLRSLALGNAPAWLKPAAHTRDAAVYECADCANQPNR